MPSLKVAGSSRWMSSSFIAVVLLSGCRRQVGPRRPFATLARMLSVRLGASPLAGGAPVTVAYRSFGTGPPLVILHGGWGYEAYPFDVEVLATGFRVLIPERSGYGRSTPVPSLPLDFHRRAMLETVAFLDALDIEGAAWWGHSDGAVIAAMAGIERPDRAVAVVLVALHLYK